MIENKHYKITVWKVLAILLLLAIVDLIISNYTSISKIDWYDVWYYIANFINDDSVPVEKCIQIQCDTE